MKKCKTLDGKYVYKIKKNSEEYFLANKENYKEDIDNLIKELDGLKFNSLIIIFGIDTAEYLNELKKNICEQNRVIIYEPNKDVFEENKVINLTHNKIKLILFEKEKVKEQLSLFINPLNFDNLYLQFFGNYEEIYKEEAEVLTQALDYLFVDSLSFMVLSNRFGEVFIRNLIWNLDIINKSTSIDKIKGKYKDVPAIIVSAGPSLEENIKSMVRNKEALKNYLVVAGSRTLKALIENGINPNLIVTIDPVDENYEMISEYINSDIPLAFYEYSNRKILSEYKGEKIYLSSILSKVVEELNTLKSIYLGGSVAHTAVDVARTLACNPIIFAGQDLAYTNEKHHAKEATFNLDKSINYEATELVKDVNGNEVKTNATLNSFRETLQDYIKGDKRINEVEYINVSNGAMIEGTIHMDFDDLFKTNIFNANKYNFKPIYNMKINRDEIINDITEFISFYIEEAKYGIEKCTLLQECHENKSLVDIDNEDKDFIEFMECFSKIINFENSKKSIFLGGYFNNFTSNIKRERFRMDVKDYERLTSNMKYQSKCLLGYFKDMKKMLEDVQKIVKEEVANFNKYHSIN
ncbi:motility associated factor glycosyltransferase family protein [Clostridium gasigenes]|uniref:motility associated factor glycosyltransferase family protein n=1 Tax=Clostridium gasigenes TaxID=94869 RepID=UPI001C0A9B87|nr:6-hydroxymethylpterin diphosphokinase MptE-like protein [Clostridium gasigenes]MBU3105430.1 DUF115 domain-containing protein [Clostridium gasigenes]